MLCKIVLLLVTWVFCYPTLSAQGTQAGVMESTRSQPKIAEYEKIIIRYRYDQPDSALFYAKKAMAFAEHLNDSIAMARILNQQGMIDDNFGRFDESREKYLRAAAIYRSAGLKKGEATVTIRLGVVEFRKGNHDQAIARFFQALKLSEAIHDKPGIMEAYLTIAEGFIGQRQYDAALMYLNMAEKLNRTLPFSSLSLNIYSNFGIIYREKGDYEQAKTWLKKGIRLSNIPQMQGLHITLLNNLATVYGRAGSREKAISLLKTSLNKARTIRNYLRELQTLTTLADIYGTANAQESLLYLRQALALATEKGAYKQQTDLLNKLSGLYKHLGKYQEALEMKEKQYLLADSFFYRRMSKQIAGLQTEHELSKSKARVQELRYINQQQRTDRQIMLGITGGIAVLLVIAGISYYRSKRLNRLLNKANQSLRESNTVKDKLFSVLAHDLRTPFASVISMLYLLDDDDITGPERKELISKLTINCNASLETLNKLLKWGEMQIKGIRLNQIIFHPAEIIQRNISLLSGAAEKKSIAINNQTDPSVSICADPDHFDFIFRNLLNNAIKFTPAGGTITISSGTGDHIPDDAWFSVKDNGVGIPSDRLPTIFSIHNVSTRGTDNEKGISLGLVMCREFIEANAGTVRVESTEGEGSEFIVAFRRSGPAVQKLLNDPLS